MLAERLSGPIRRTLGSRVGVLLALIAGAALPFAFSPFDYAVLAALSPALLFAIVASTDSRWVWRVGFAWGLGFFGVGVSWVFVSISEFGGGPIAGAAVTVGFVILLAAFPAVLAAATRLIPTRSTGADVLRLLVLLPVGWVLLEWVRSWLFTGFPWLLLGYAALDTPLAALAPVVGVYGLSAVWVVIAGVLAWFVLRPGWRRALPVALVFAAVGGVAQWGGTTWTERAGEPVEAAVVQGNVPQDIKWHPEYRGLIRDRYTAGTEAVLGADLIVWPETAIPEVFQDIATDYLEPVGDVVTAMGGTLITGTPYRDERADALYNSVIAMTPEQPTYHKRHLVPYGEYVPFRDVFGRSLDFLGAPMADFTPGPVPHALPTPVGPVGATVCYEIAYPRAVAATAGESALLVTVSNDAWFGDSLAPHQHFQKARMRALENERDLIRATNTGISGVIDAQGRVVERLPSFEQATGQATVTPRAGATPYTQYGELPVLLPGGLLFGALVLWGVWWRRSME